MASLKKKAINASTKLKHSLKKVLISLVEREGEVSEERRGEESAKDVSSDSREGALVLKALGFNISISFLRKQLDHKRFKELLELHHNKHVGSVCNSCQGSS
ncbi:BnaC09g54040D [Brassica napus]|uniref:BnaC09g54040D protein n=3 Tax=Brassica TaxID=3705 RepID=A0A078JWX4_BRANA|nr:BnaC09g54040D [Brassica napus]VDD33072.1 unnamed protein product [Brassica oleracea]